MGEKRTMALQPQQKQQNKQNSIIFVASLNQDMKTNYPGLLLLNNKEHNDNLMIHGYKYKEYDAYNNNNNLKNKDDNNNNIVAKNIIAIYDLITENVKSNNDMYTLGRFDIHASCGGSAAANDDTNLDQIRIETMGNYPAAIINPDWYHGLQYLYQGIDKDHSLSTFATQSIFTNLYKK